VRTLRVLALSNEPTEGFDPDIPWAFDRQLEKGAVESFLVYSVPERLRSIGGPAVVDELVGLSRESFDVLAFFNSGSCRFTQAEVHRLRLASPHAVWICYEGDAFLGWLRPYPRWARSVLASCSAAFVILGGYLPRIVRKAGCPFVTYAPSWVNTSRFEKIWSCAADHSHDVVFIGNNVKSLTRPFPGTRDRARLVAGMQQRYGRRFAVYGAGWTGSGAMGPCSFDDVGRIYAESRVCLGIDHVMGAFQFSNRLPIALANGIPLAHADFTGARELFQDLTPEQFFDRPEQAGRVVDRLLAMEPDAAEALSARERAAALRLSCECVLDHMLDVCKCLLAGGDPAALPNPWLADARVRL
jgi:hypothetical protein